MFNSAYATITGWISFLVIKYLFYKATMLYLNLCKEYCVKFL